MVGVVDGEATDQVDRVLVGADAFAAAADQADAELAACPALPEDLDLGDVLRPSHGDHDLADQGAEQLLAIAVAGGLGRPELRQVARQAGERFALQRAERSGSGVLQGCERALFARDAGERFFALALERPRAEPVLELARVDRATGSLRLAVGA